MTREEILKKADEIMELYAEDPQKTMTDYSGHKNPFLAISKEDYAGYCDRNDPIFDLILGMDSLLVAYISLDEARALYLEAFSYKP